MTFTTQHTPTMVYVFYDGGMTGSELFFRGSLYLAIYGFCIYISLWSQWWTFVSSVIFIFYFFSLMAMVMRDRKKTFKTKEELLKYIMSIEE